MKLILALTVFVIANSAFAEQEPQPPVTKGPHGQSGEGKSFGRAEAPMESPEDRLKKLLSAPNSKMLKDALCAPEKVDKEVWAAPTDVQAEYDALRRRLKGLLPHSPELEQGNLRRDILEKFLKLKDHDEFRRYLKITKAWVDKVAPEKNVKPQSQMPYPQGGYGNPFIPPYNPGQYPGQYPGQLPSQQYMQPPLPLPKLGPNGTKRNQHYGLDSYRNDGDSGAPLFPPAPNPLRMQPLPSLPNLSPRESKPKFKMPSEPNPRSPFRKPQLSI